MVELTEFPQLAQRYHVMGVPKTMINETVGIDGALPDGAFIDRLIASLEEGEGT